MSKLKPSIEFYFYLTLTIYFGWQLILAGSAFLQFFQDVLMIVFLGWFLYFLLNPVVKFLVKQKIPRILAILIVFVVLLTIISLSLSVLIPKLAGQLFIFNENLPQFISNSESWVMVLLQRFKGLKFINQEVVDNLINTYGAQVIAFSSSLVSNWLAILSVTVNVTLNMIMILLLGIFFLVDEKTIAAYFKRIIPPSYYDEFLLLDKKIHTSFGGFVRGQVILGVINGLCTWLVLTLLGVNVALLAGIVAAVVMMIPFFNGFIGFIPGVIITLLIRPEVWLIVFIVLFVIHQIEFNVISPKIMGDAIGLHPIVVIVALLVGMKLAGVFGSIFAIPIAGVLAVFPEFFLYERKKIEKST